MIINIITISFSENTRLNPRGLILLGLLLTGRVLATADPIAPPNKSLACKALVMAALVEANRAGRVVDLASVRARTAPQCEPKSQQ